MKTLILEGSARKNGRTAEMIHFLQACLPGETEVIRAYEQKISPCLDCRYCLKHPCCAVKDGMGEIDEKLENSDAVVFAAPVYFHSVPAPLKTIIDRLQPYWAATVRKDGQRYRPKKGGLLLVGGAPSFEDQFLPASLMLRRVLHDLRASHEGTVALPNADRDSLADRADLQAELRQLAQKLAE